MSFCPLAGTEAPIDFSPCCFLSPTTGSRTMSTLCSRSPHSPKEQGSKLAAVAPEQVRDCEAISQGRVEGCLVRVGPVSKGPKETTKWKPFCHEEQKMHYKGSVENP